MEAEPVNSDLASTLQRSDPYKAPWKRCFGSSCPTPHDLFQYVPEKGWFGPRDGVDVLYWLGLSIQMGQGRTLEGGRLYSSQKRTSHWHLEPSFEASCHALRYGHIDHEDLALQADSNHVRFSSGMLFSARPMPGAPPKLPTLLPYDIGET